MSFPARVFQILIASPSDVTEEREIAVRAIQEWNDLNAAEQQLVLLPLRWETHSAPEYGKRPQEVINRQVVDYCDLLLGIFWTRVGSPTGVADSGTIEEIERVASKGKPVMLYFSQARQDPENIDVEQLLKLREFKKKTFPRALVESYSTTNEFKDKISRQIEIQLRSLVAGKESVEHGFNIRPVTDIDLQFADPDTGTPIGNSQTLKTIYVKLDNFDKVPNYTRPVTLTAEGNQSEIWSRLLREKVNKDYYRQKLAWRCPVAC
jgi:nucleoside 2-deoxyribosyltransferase